jgi:hypothetical protein
MTHDVFICHANQDRAVAEAICAALEKNGVSCWMAPRDVIAGEDWDKAITRALDQSRILVLIFSASSNDSDYCINEVNIAFDNKEDIIPFFIDDTLPSGAMQLYLKRKQWLNAQKSPLEPHLVRLVNEVKSHLTQVNAREEAAREKARQEEQDRLQREAEERIKTLEAAAAQKKAEEAEKLKEQQAAAQAQKEVEETGKARQAAEKARQEAEAAIKEKELLEAEAARVREEARAAIREKERLEAELSRVQQEAEAAKKASEAAEKARKEAEASIKEKQLREAQAASARKEAEAASKEKQLREAQAASARKEADAAAKASEAAIKVGKEAKRAEIPLKEEALSEGGPGWFWSGVALSILGLGLAIVFSLLSGKLSFSAQWPNTPWSPIYPQWAFMLLISLPFIIPGIIFMRRGARGYRQHDGSKASGWWWLPAVVLGFLGSIIAWFNIKNSSYRRARNMLTTGILLTLLLPAVILGLAKAVPQETEPPVSAADNITSTATTTPSVSATTTPVFTTTGTAVPSQPNEYLDITLNSTSFDKSEVNGSEVFFAQISGNITCLGDIPFDVSGVSITPEVIARLTGGGPDITLVCSADITLNSVPVHTGETATFSQALPLSFPQDTDTGYYNISMRMKQASVNIGLWVDVSDYFDTESELTLSWIKVTHVAALSYNYIEGHIYVSGTNTPIGGANVQLISVRESYGDTIDSVVAVATSNSAGYYKSSPFISSGPFLLRVTADGYETRWYNNTSNRDDATDIYFNEVGETVNIDFFMQIPASISGRVTADVGGQGISGVTVTLFDYLSNQYIQS